MLRVSCENEAGARIVKTMPLQSTIKYSELASWVQLQFKITADKVFKLRARDTQYITNQTDLDAWLIALEGTRAYNLWLEVTVKDIRFCSAFAYRPEILRRSECHARMTLEQG